MKLLFSQNQPYQLDAIRAVTDIFEGQELRKSEELKIKSFMQYKNLLYYSE